MQTSHHHNKFRRLNNHYRGLLIDLGILDNLLTPDLDCIVLYKRLHKILNSISPLICNTSWQLQILGNEKFDLQLLKNTHWHDNRNSTPFHYAAWTGNLNTLVELQNNHSGFLNTKNDKGATPIHFAARSGDIKALNWIKDNYPQFFKQKDNDGSTPIHYAAWSGEIQVLDWIKDNYSQFFEKKDKTGLNPIHYAALSGEIRALNWIKENYPHLLTQENRGGSTSIHYATQSGKIPVLNWIKKYYPQFLEQENRGGLTPIHFTAGSRNPAALNHALSLTNNPQKWTLQGLKDDDIGNIIAQTLLKALETNYTLTAVDLDYCSISEDIKYAIACSLMRNCQIKLCTLRYMAFMQGCSEANSLVSMLSHVQSDVGRIILKSMLPPDVDAERVFKDITRNMTLQIRALKCVDENITRLDASKKENNTLFSFLPLHSFFNNSDEKMQALTALKVIVTNNPENIDEEVTAWETKYSQTIIKHRNIFDDFFSQDKITKTALCLQNVKTIFGIYPINFKMLCFQ